MINAGQNRLRRKSFLDKEPILVEQLKLLLSNLGTSFVLVLLVVVILVLCLANESENEMLVIWAVSVLVAKLATMIYANSALASNSFALRPYRTVFALIGLSAVYGIAWGVLVWITLDATSLAEGVLIMATLAGVTSNAISILSPVLPISIAFCVFELSVVAVKLWHMEALAFKALALIVALYVAMLVSEARRIAAATRAIINLRFELEESHRQMREIEQREILNSERQRLMQDMHDGLGASLAGALRTAEHGKATTTELAQILRDCIDDLKLAIDSMELVEADLLLLLATLRYRLSTRLESCDITLHWDVRPVPTLGWLDRENALHVLRILQEAFTNIIKHTHATEILVTTHAGNNHVSVTINDNGQGFSIEEALKLGGRGLSNQIRRAEMIGGEVNWNSGNMGTCFTLRLPIERQPEPV